MFNFWKRKPPAFKVIRGRFDAAQTNRDNARHWAAARMRRRARRRARRAAGGGGP